MPDFAYTARDTTGRKVAGTISAGSQREALALLAKQSLFPIAVRDELPQPTPGRFRRVKPLAVATMYGQLASLLRSGVPLLRSLNVLREQTSHSGLKFVLGEVCESVEQGKSLAEAMSKYPKVFGEIAISMVRAGGEGAFLEDALDRVAEFTEKQQDLKSRTIGALAYPIFLAVFGTIIINVLIIFFVPMFAEMFGRLREKGELPGLTEALLGFSAFMRSWWWVLGIIFFALVALLKVLLDSPKGKLARDRIALKLPIVGTVFQSLAVSRFCRVLGTLLRNGVPILRALEISRGATGNRVLAEAVDEAAANISAGQSLARPLAASGKFPRNVCEMISVAEEANTLDAVLIRTSDDLDRQTWRKLDLAVRLLEPLMLMILAGAVLVVALALLLPIMKMGTTI